MPQYPIVNQSEDGKIIQLVDDIQSRDLSVVHHINLDEKQMVRMGRIEVVDKEVNEIAFNKACVDFNLIPNIAKIFVIFYYDLYNDDTRDYRSVETFPLAGGGHFVPGKDKVVAVATVQQPSGTTVSRTGGEAL